MSKRSNVEYWTFEVLEELPNNIKDRINIHANVFNNINREFNSVIININNIGVLTK